LLSHSTPMCVAVCLAMDIYHSASCTLHANSHDTVGAVGTCLSIYPSHQYAARTCHVAEKVPCPSPSVLSSCMAWHGMACMDRAPSFSLPSTDAPCPWTAGRTSSSTHNTIMCISACDVPTLKLRDTQLFIAIASKQAHPAIMFSI
jgi:hypothetical protein